MRTALASGVVSAAELCDATLRGIDAGNPSINAFVASCGEAAIADAVRLDAVPEDRRGPLHGIPVAIKDLHHVRGLPNTLGSLAWRDAVSPQDDRWVASLREAGAVIVGKTNTSELGNKSVTTNRLFGTTRNPWARVRGTGGSSGGAAAAVAAGLVPLADGSDAGGSVRSPAACCGVVGLKPSRGPVLADDFGGLNTVGSIARTVTDATLLMDALAGPRGASLTDLAAGDPGPQRLAHVAPGGGAWAPDVAESFEASLCRLREMGHDLVEVDLNLDELRGPWQQIVYVHLAAMAAQLTPAEMAHLEPANLSMMIAGARIPATEYHAQLARARSATRRLADALRGFTALVTPTRTTPAGRFDELTWESDEDEVWSRYFRSAHFQYPFNVTGQPAITVRSGMTVTGLPLGLQFVGPVGGDVDLMRLARAFEESVQDQLPELPVMRGGERCNDTHEGRPCAS